MKYIFFDNTYMVFILLCENTQNTYQIVKQTEKTRRSNRVLYGALCKARAYSITVSDHRSTCIRYQKTISCAVIIYDKTSSSNYNVTAPIEQVQDKSIHHIVSNISCRFLCKIKMQYLPIFLLVFLYKYTLKSRVFPNELKILHLDRYRIPFFLLKVWYALERFRIKLNLHASRRETNKMAELY